jgi:hypothetical protein
MSISPKHHTLISGLLLICSVVSLLLFLQLRYYPGPPGINGQALEAAFSSGSSSLQMYERFTGGTLARSQFWLFSRSFVPAVLVLTIALAVWNFRICRRQS